MKDVFSEFEQIHTYFRVFSRSLNQFSEWKLWFYVGNFLLGLFFSHGFNKWRGPVKTTTILQRIFLYFMWKLQIVWSSFFFSLAMASINGVILSNQQLFCNVYVKITSWMVLIFQTANVVSRGQYFTLEITLLMIVVRGIFRNNLITICKEKADF